jgi:F-type H+-transporting ATPase subunit b
MKSPLRPLRKAALVAVLSGYAAFMALPVGVAWAQHEGHDHHDHDHGHAPPPAANRPGARPEAPKAKPAAHGAEHGGHHGPGHMNWFHGLLAEKDGITEPDLLFRPKGMPAPFLANIINFGLVVFLLVTKAGPAISKSLIERRDDLQRDIEAAAKAKAEAQARFEEQKSREEHIEEEVTRIRSDYAAQGKHDLERIEREGRERHERFVREARTLIEQEGRALRQRMLIETVEAVTSSAQEALSRQISPSDQERLASEYLAQLDGLSMKRGEA